MNSRTMRRIGMTAMSLLIGLAVMPSSLAQNNQSQIWKQMAALEKSAHEQLSGKDYRGAANTMFDVLGLANQLPANDAKLKTHFQSIEANLAIIDSRLEQPSDLALRERVLRERLPLTEKLFGKDSLSYQVGLKKLMFVLSRQGKNKDAEAFNNQLVRDTSGPAPKSPSKTIGSRSPRPKH